MKQVNTVALSLALAFLCTFVWRLADGDARTDKLRGSVNKVWFKRQRTGRIRLFISAIQRGGHFDSVMVMLLAPVVVVLTVSLHLWIRSIDLDRTVSESEASLSEMESRFLAASEPLKSASVPPRENLQGLAAELKDLKAQHSAIRNEANSTILLTRTISAIFGLAGLVIGFVWIDRGLKRYLFAHLINKLALRLQGLATKSELADFARSEFDVRDEPSLAEFITCARTIASRHDLTKLVDAFDVLAV